MSVVVAVCRERLAAGRPVEMSRRSAARVKKDALLELVSRDIKEARENNILSQ